MTPPAGATATAVMPTATPAATPRRPWRRCTTGAVRYRAGVVGAEFLTGGAPTADIIEYADGSMAFNPTVGWGKDGLAHSIRSALDREHACRAAGWDSTPDSDEEAA